MSDLEKHRDYYRKAIQFPGVSGFQILELLDVRSKLAGGESELDAAQRVQLEEADSRFLRDAPASYESVARIGDLGELRRRAGVPCSHWWWYLEKLAHREPVKA